MGFSGWLRGLLGIETVDTRYIFLAKAVEVLEDGVEKAPDSEREGLLEVAERLASCGYPDLEVRARLAIAKLRR